MKTKSPLWHHDWGAVGYLSIKQGDNNEKDPVVLSTLELSFFKSVLRCYDGTSKNQCASEKIFGGVSKNLAT